MKNFPAGFSLFCLAVLGGLAAADIMGYGMASSAGTASARQASHQASHFATHYHK